MPKKGRLLNDWLETFLQWTELTNKEPPILYRTWSGIGVIAGALQRKCYFARNPTMIVYPNLYIVLVGQSGRTRKSTAIKQGKYFVKKLGIPLAPAALSKERLMQKLEEIVVYSEEPGGIVVPHNSLSAFSSELAVLVKFKDPEMQSLLTDIYDCEDDYNWEFKQAGHHHLEGAFLNLVGGITPSTFREIFPQLSVELGLAPRMILVYEEQGNIEKDPSEPPKGRLLRQKLETDLEAIHEMVGEFKATKEFIKAYESWYVGQRRSPPKHITQDSRFDGYLGRRQDHIYKVALGLSASRSSEMILEERDFKRALAILEETEKNMPYVFKGYGSTQEGQLLRQVKDYIRSYGEVTYQDVLVNFMEQTNYRDFNMIIRSLIKGGVVKQLHDKGGSKTEIYDKLVYVFERKEKGK